MTRLITEKIKSSPQEGGVCLILSENDLRSVVREMYAEERQRTEKAIAENREVPTISRRDAARMLNITTSTLWRWDKEGYLSPVKVGSKVLYRSTDIDRLLNRAEKGGAL